MCFKVYGDHNAEKTAKRDIVCYKILKKSLQIVKLYHSPYRTTPYRLTKSNTFIANVQKLQVVCFDKINAGLHSYSNLKEAKREKDWNETIVKFIIPKKISYYYNPDRMEYVSLELKFVKIL